MRYQKIDTSEILTPEQVKAQMPDVAWNFSVIPPAAALANWGLSIYVEPVESIESIRGSQWISIKAERDRRKEGGYKVDKVY